MTGSPVTTRAADDTAERQDSLRQIEAEVGVLIKRVRRVIAERAQEVHESLHPTQLVLLNHLADHGPLRASTIVEHFAMDKASVSRQVQHLIELGLVDRTPDPQDGRATLLSVSDEGRRRLTDVAAHRRKLLDERLGDWDDEDLAGFAETLARYNATLEARRS
jgi:DNA-binding MarR family transcriptional regulator